LGFRPTLIQVPASVHAEASFLASEKGTWKETGITVDSTLVGADANGDKILKAGTVMGKVTASNKWRAYVNNAADGSQTPVGFLAATINLRWGDVIVGLLVGGSVRTARCSGLDTSAQTALTGRFVLQ
jgi:hypothetical protein